MIDGPSSLEPHWPRLVLAGLGLALLVTVLATTAISATAFGPYNPFWDGTSEFRGELEADDAVETKLVRDPGRYSEVDPEGTVAFVIAPDPESGDDELASFVADGGRLVVLESVGEGGNELLSAVGATARFDGRIVHDELEYDRGPTMPVAGNVSDELLGDDIDELTLNHGTAVEPGNATVLVTTGEFSYLLGPDEEPEDAEEFEAYPVATVERVGEGEVVVVGDPSLTVNAMLDRTDNDAFLHRTYDGQERVLLDATGSGDVPPLIGAVLTVRETPLLQVLLGSVAVGAVAATSSRRVRSTVGSARERLGAVLSEGETTERTGRPELTHEEQVTFLQRRYPEWDEERISRTVKAINRTDVERGDE